MIESDFKKRFKDSVKYYGGFAASTSSNLYTGFPDMYCVVPGYTPVLIEAKFLKEVGPKFKRVIKYSPTQRAFLENCNKVQQGTAFGLVGFQQDRKLYACLIDYRYVHIDSDYYSYCGVGVVDRKTKFFDVPKMFEWANKLRYNHSVAEKTFDDFFGL